MKSSNTSKILRLNRFTTLPVLLDLLTRGKLVLLDPATWEDKNDSGFLQEYASRKAIRVHALCFTLGNETIHHWRTFADGISGCYIDFDPVRLLKVFDKNDLRHDPVKYKKLRNVRRGSIATDDIPFTKRQPYQCEKEYRVIHEDKEERPTFEIDVELSLIRRITISQKMPLEVYESVKHCLLKAFSFLEKRVYRSTIYENSDWLGKI